MSALLKKLKTEQELALAAMHAGTDVITSQANALRSLAVAAEGAAGSMGRLRSLSPGGTSGNAAIIALPNDHDEIPMEADKRLDLTAKIIRVATSNTSDRCRGSRSSLPRSRRRASSGSFAR